MFERRRKKLDIRQLLIIIIILLITLGVVITVKGISFRKELEPPTALANELPRFRLIDMDNIGIETDEDKDGINDQKDILLGAKKQLEIRARNIFLEGEKEPNYYPGGDPPPDLAVSTDIVARAFREAGFDLKELVHEDIIENFNAYPLREIWNQRFPDPNIDYRRIQNLEVFFKRNAISLTTVFSSLDKENLNSWLPGDVVFFDMDEDGYADNVGIISDTTTRDGTPKVIYNYIDPGFTCEENILGQKPIKGHFRFPDPQKKFSGKEG